MIGRDSFTGYAALIIIIIIKELFMYDSIEEYEDRIGIQFGNHKLIEAAVRTDESTFDLSFLYNYGNISSINYVVEDLGQYKVIVVYLNLH